MNHFKRLAATALIGFASFAAQATPVVVDVSGAQSVNLQGEAGNTVWLVNIGANAMLNSLDWAVTLSAFAPSSLSEMRVSFGATSGPMYDLMPDVVAGFSGTGSYAGSASLAGLGIAAGADGLLRIEFSEDFKDFGFNVAEGQWLSGNLTFDVSAVPEPASAAFMLMGLGLVAAARRRRPG
jgi:MYXO-CTERM domain-containing protein